ncbi:hypothetical protein AB9L11_00865 [Desulfovibrio piger]
MSRLLFDFQAMAADLGRHEMTVPGVDAPVMVVARDLGVQRLDPEDQSHVGERAHFARAWYSVDDLDRRLERGQTVTLWGYKWQVRSCRNLGMGTGEVFGLTLTRQPVKRGA